MDLQIIHERRWKEVTSKFDFPATATNASFVMRKYYFSLLNNYEQIYFFRTNSQMPPGFNSLQQTHVLEFTSLFCNIISSVDSLQNQSTVVGLGTIRPPQELQAPQPRIDFGGLNFCSLLASIDGLTVTYKSCCNCFRIFNWSKRDWSDRWKIRRRLPCNCDNGNKAA